MPGRQTKQNEIERLAGIYDALAANWDERQGRAENSLGGDKFRDQLVRELKGDVLEIGAGTGETIRRLQRISAPVTSYTGTDISTAMLAQASRYRQDSRVTVALHQANAEALTMFADNSFDTVTGSLVLCTVPDNVAALREMARVVRPDGRIVLMEHVLAKNPLLKGVMKMVASFQVRHMGCHIDRQTDQIIRNLGFRVEQDRTRLMGIFHLIVARPPHQ